MSEAVAKIVRLERRVMWRRRLLSLQDLLAMAAVIGGIIAAVLVLLVRLRNLQMPIWTLVVGVLGLSLTAALARWFFSSASERDAAFLIDESLDLEDRVATAHLIIARGGPRGALEEALIEDTAERAGDQAASSVIPLKIRQWHVFAPVSLIALVAALMITPRGLPVTEALAAERADIDNAAGHLERTAAEVENVPVGTETARLANEQAEFGRGLRRSTATRAEVLKRLSGLEERIRLRHDDLASTRADEIVTLADRRLGSALSTLSTAQRKKPQPDGGKLAVSADEAIDLPKREPRNENRAVRPSGDKASNSRPANENSGLTASKDRVRPGDNQTKAEDAKKREAAEAENRPQEPASGKDSRIDSVKTAPGDTSKANPAPDKTTGDRSAGDLKANAENTDEQKNADPKNAEREKGEQRPSDKVPSATDALKAAPDFLVNQAVKALPKLSEDLLKKAAQLRANELSPADIEKLRQAAESLSRDLSQIAQSKELQRALQEMARQVRPEQIEQVARELGNQEKLKQELESAARLLTENQQAKEIVAGLAGEFSRVRDEMKKQQRNEKADGQQASESRSRNEQTDAADRVSRSGDAKSTDKSSTAIDRRLAGRGRESSLQSKIQQVSRGEYLYLQTKAGAGAARAPYSSAFPQYRRAAERSVQRTQVPPNLRSVVRKYFDAINPDSKR